MADTKETLFAQAKLLDYLHGSRSARTVKEILVHLQQHTDWGQSQLDKKLPDGGLRNVQNWLKYLRESAEFGQQITWEPDPANRKQFQYRSSRSVAGSQNFSIEQACLLLLAEKYLDAALPAEFYETSLHDVFSDARSTLAQYEKQQRYGKRAVRTYLNRVAMAQRGQHLWSQSVPYKVMGVISKAILDGRCVELRYKEKPRVLHPYGIVIRDPKIYLLAVDDRAMAKFGPAEVQPIQYLCHRVKKAAVSRRPNRVPDRFNADKFIQKGGLESAFRQQLDLAERSFTLKLRIHESDDSFIQDLNEFPLSPEQRIDREPDRTCYLLRIPRMHASYQLVEWVLGRTESVEVLAPTSLRRYIRDRIGVMHTLYSDNC